jgi:hypothetical protein
MALKIGWAHFEKVSRKKQKSTNDVFVIKDLSEQPGSPTTFSFVIFADIRRYELATSIKVPLQFPSPLVTLAPMLLNNPPDVQLPPAISNHPILPAMDGGIGFMIPLTP